MDFLIPKRWAWLGVALIVVARSSVAQVSPGPLAAPHAGLEGLRNCLKCHSLGAGPSANKCLACHEEIATGIGGKRGYHHAVVSVESRACFECHGEHAGRAFKMIDWPRGTEGFDHRKTGIPLEGKHATLKCRDCHKTEFVRDDPRAFQKAIDLNRTYLGLRKECLGCHVDEHRKQLSEDCIQCHGYAKWMPAIGFDHGRAKYRLTGKHKHVDCAKCHPAITVKPPENGAAKTKGKVVPPPRIRATGSKKKVDRSFIKYAGIRFGACKDCHKDAHKGKFARACKDCHRTSDWHTVVAKHFDHSKTGFKLKGRHKKVDCQKCHGNKSKLKRMKSARCRDCHKDIHRGQFARRRDRGRCEACHTEDGFVPAHFTVRDHGKTRFALTGAHMALPCIACHKEVRDEKKRTYRSFTIKSTRCEACHKDVHAGQFRRRGRKMACTACHKTTEWSVLSFDHNRDSSFRLEGRHAEVRCSGCHQKVRTKHGAIVRYRPINHACKTCHVIVQ